MTTSIDSDHERHHKAAYLRVRRIRTIEHIGLIAAATLTVTAIVTGAAGSLAGAGVLAAALAAWHYLGRVDNPATREAAACRTEYAAYMARSAAEAGAPSPDDPQRERLCARLDRAEAALPWWVRTR